MLPQQYCLRWKYHHSNLQTMFSQLLDRGCFCDVTLACEGQLIRAHRVVLCACSTFFDTVLTNYASERDPIIIMKDVTFADIKCLIEFMYKGEINVEHSNLASLLKTADDLKIKGLAEVTWRDDEDIPPPPPTPQTEFHSPSQIRRRDSHNYDNYNHENQQRSQSPNQDTEREQKTPSPKHSAISARLPTLTPIPTSAVSIVAAGNSPIDSYLGPKRKRGRPPLDDAYDVFNVRKLGHYSDTNDGAYLEGSQYTTEDTNNKVSAQHSRPNSPSAATSAYQQHIQQQKQRLRYRSSRSVAHDDQIDDETANEPEWITSTLEHDNETKNPSEQNAREKEEKDKEPPQVVKEEQEETAIRRCTEKRSKESLTPEHPKMKALKRKNSKEESLQHHKPDSHDEEDEAELTDLTNVPQTVEEIETTVQQSSKEKPSTNGHNSSTSISATTNCSSSTTSSAAVSPPSTSAAHKASSSTTPSSSHSASVHHHHSHHGHLTHSHHTVPPLHPHTHHFGKYVPEGYLINEHGILMTHDFIHAPTASIPTSSSSVANGHHPDDYVDIKMEEFSEAELRLTSEEMTQWQDVIKMDDYLAKGRRPQFWEEPFTRRVLDAIKNKRLEMKKAARILGVSYGTLYGRYREVYGCLKHPYSSTSLRPSQSSALSVQPRFDIVWPSPKPGQLDIGKLRPKDLSELWARPQI